MADWKKTAKAFLLADGRIDDREVAVLRQELFADGRVDEIEMDFLLELWRGAERAAPAFHFLMVEALKSWAIADGVIKPGVASLLRRWLLSGGQVGYLEQRYLQELRSAARQAPPDFDELYRQVVGG